MHKLNKTIAICLSFIIFNATTAMAWLWQEKPLATINGQTYTADDFKNWWSSWREKDTLFPATPDPFIDWHLLVQEAQRMELDTEPSFQHKVNVFLKVRALNRLKHEEIDSKIHVDEKEIWTSYENNFTPRHRLEVLYFNTEENAAKAREALHSGATTIAKLIEKKTSDDQSEEDSGFRHHMENWYRAPRLAQEWQDALGEMNTGDISSVLTARSGFAFFILHENKGPEKDDLETVKKRVIKPLLDKKRSELNTALIRRLLEKYHVTINENLLADLDPYSVPDDLLDEKLATMDGGVLDVRFFAEQIQEGQKYRRYLPETKKEKDRVKRQTLNTILFQTLTDKESLARNYEKKPPLKPIYEFYRQHRLIKELEKRFRSKHAKVDENEISQYYQKNLNQFSLPGRVKITMIEGEGKLIQKMWAEIIQGEDFFFVEKKYFSRESPAKEIPLDELSQPIKDTVKRLSKGEVSTPVSLEGENRMALVKLIDRKPTMPIPLEKVRDQIVTSLKKSKFKQERTLYLEKIKNLSRIKLNKKVWEAIHNELGG